MKDKIKPYLGLFFKVFIPTYLLFIILTFPTNDIKHKITEIISTSTQNQVQLQFEKVEFGLFPSPSLILKDVDLNLRNLNPLKAGSLKVAPSLLGLITFNPGVNVRGNDIFMGEVEASYRGGSKTKKDIEKKILNITARDIQVKDLLDFLQKKFNIKTNLNVKLESEYDPTFAEGISGILQMQTGALSLKDVNIPTDLGPVNIPNLKISKINIDLEMKDKVWQIKSAQIGQDGDSIYGNITGDANVRLMASPAGPRLSNLSYDINLKLNIAKAFINELAFKALIDSYLSNANAKYQSLNIKIKASSMRSPPKITKIR